MSEFAQVTLVERDQKKYRKRNATIVFEGSDEDVAAQQFIKLTAE